MRGALRIAADGRSFVDDGGDYLPMVCHAGDFLSRWHRDPAGVLVDLSAIKDAGYDGVRTWTVLGESSYWAGREIGPWMGEAYWSTVRAYASALRSLGLKWLVSQGDMLRILRGTEERRTFMRRLAQELALEDVLGVDAGNEALWNGETDPGAMLKAVEAFREVVPCAVWSLTSPGSEEGPDLDTFSGSVFDVHGYRDGRSWDKLRHIFSIAYEGGTRRRLGIQSEPFGPGARVSAISNRQELTEGVQMLAAAQSLLARQVWVYFSGPGVISDEKERIYEMPGFQASPRVRAFLPKDLMRFGALVHGGASQRGRRVYAVPGTDETRCDQAIHEDGRFVAILYGPRWREIVLERPAEELQVLDCGQDGRIVIGRLR